MHKTKHAAMAVLFGLGFSAAGTAHAQTLTESCVAMYKGFESGVPVVESAVPARMLQLVNAERAKVGAQPLALNAQLGKAAQAHAHDMTRRNFFSHTSPEGCSMTHRVRNFAGYIARTWGENIAAGYSTPERTMAQWMASPGHKANILNKSFKELGVGFVSNPNAPYRHYWVQNFGAR